MAEEREEVIDTEDDGTNTTVTDTVFDETQTTTTTPDVVAPEPPQPPVAPLAQEFGTDAGAGTPAPDAGSPDVSVADAANVDPNQAVQDVTSPGDADVNSIPASEAPAEATAEPTGTQTNEGAGSLEDSPHSVVDDSIGQAQTAAYNDVVGTDGPTGEELPSTPEGTAVPQGAMPANGVWPEQHPDQEEEGVAANQPADLK